MPQRFQVFHFDSPIVELREKLDSVLPAGERNDWRLQIPLWQRRYDWGKEQFETLRNDLLEATDKRPVRLGTLVLAYSTQGWTEKVNPLEASETKIPPKVWIVDGQQRLRTVNNLYNTLHEEGIKSEQPSATKQRRIKLCLYDGLNRPLDDINSEACFRDSIHRKEFRDVFCGAKQPDLKQVDNIQFHVVLVKVDDENVSEKEFNRLLPPYFERLNRQAKPLDPEDVFKAKLIFACREHSGEDLVHRLNTCWDRAKRIIYEPMPAPDAERDVSAGSIWDQITGNKRLPDCPIRDEKSRREGFCRLLLLTGAFARNADANPRIKRDELLNATTDQFTAAMFGVENFDYQAKDVPNYIENFESVLNIFKRYREYLLVSRTHLGDRSRQITKDEGAQSPDKEPQSRKWRQTMLQLCCYLDAAGGRTWLANDYLLRLIKELCTNTSTENDIEGAARRAVRTIERELFSHLKDPGRGDEPDAYEKNKSKNWEMLVARDWLLWQAYSSEVGGPDSLYGQAIDEALDAVQLKTEAKKAIAERMQPDNSSGGLPSSSGAGEIEHWFALHRGRNSGSDVREDDLNRSANYAFIANGLNQSLRDLTVREKAVLIRETGWPNLRFLAAVTLAGIPPDSTDSKESVMQWFRWIDLFWETVQEQVLAKLKSE